MKKEEILLKQQEIIKIVLGDDSLEITSSTSAHDIDDWDSFTHLEIIAETEKAFKLRFALAELQSLQNVGEMTDLIFGKII